MYIVQFEIVLGKFITKAKFFSELALVSEKLQRQWMICFSFLFKIRFGVYTNVVDTAQMRAHVCKIHFWIDESVYFEISNRNSELI